MRKDSDRYHRDGDIKVEKKFLLWPKYIEMDGQEKKVWLETVYLKYRFSIPSHPAEIAYLGCHWRTKGLAFKEAPDTFYRILG